MHKYGYFQSQYLSGSACMCDDAWKDDVNLSKIISSSFDTMHVYGSSSLVRLRFAHGLAILYFSYILIKLVLLINVEGIDFHVEILV